MMAAEVKVATEVVNVAVRKVASVAVTGLLGMAVVWAMVRMVKQEAQTDKAAALVVDSRVADAAGWEVAMAEARS